MQYMQRNSMRNFSFIRAAFIPIFLLLSTAFALSQTQGSPSNWLYLQGNSEATRYQQWKSLPQSFDSIAVRWISREIYNVQPLVGNIVNNPRISSAYPWYPNEIAAVISGQIVILNADGSLINRSSSMPPYVNRLSVLFDSVALAPDLYTVSPVVMGLEIGEHYEDDSVARHFIAGYSEKDVSTIVLKRLAVNLRDFAPNNAASMTPVFGRSSGGETIVYSVINMSNPSETSDPLVPSFFRGLTQFNTKDFRFPFPRPDTLDDATNRFLVGPEVAVSPPSITTELNRVTMLLPCYPTLNLKNNIVNPASPLGDITFPSKNYLLNVDLQGARLQSASATSELVEFKSGVRPFIRPYFVRLTDPGSSGGNEKLYILATEEFSGRFGSGGISALHLYDPTDGAPITYPPPHENPSFYGGKNHFWSVGVGDADGNGGNESMPFYPNNPGNEIIVTQSTQDFAYPGSHLMVLRYRTGTRIEKPTTRKDSLHYFDTIATKRVNGWLAAVNDFDGAADGKVEIFLVNGDMLRVMRMRNYEDPRFRTNEPFDTVYQKSFGGETITAVEIVDLDGDGCNDILVTTIEKTYMLSKAIVGKLQILEPIVSDTLCDGEPVRIRWRNSIVGKGFVNVYAQRYQNGIPIGAPKLIKFRYLNDQNIVELNPFYVVNTDSLAGDVRFIVESYETPTLRDSSAILRFQPPTITLDPPPNGPTFRIGDTVRLSGRAKCLTEVRLEYRLPALTNATWQAIITVPVLIDSTYSYTETLLCNLYPLFSCGTSTGGLISYRAIGTLNGNPFVADTSAEYTIRVIPDTLLISISTKATTLVPEREISWTVLPAITECDTLTIAISYDAGKTFSTLIRAGRNDGLFTWKLPVGIPDSALFRFCCEGGCAQSEQWAKGLTPKIVKVVAPNPFEPNVTAIGSAKPGVNVLYYVPKDVNVSMRIFDESNRLVAEPLNNALRVPGIYYCDNWDGTIEGKGTPAANGMYYLVVEFSSGEREVYPIFIRKKY